MSERVKRLKGERAKRRAGLAPFTDSPVNAFKSQLTLANRQRTRRLNPRLLRKITEAALAELPGVTGSNLTFYFIGANKMANINEAHLGHKGPTDVITFNYCDHASRIMRHVLYGEIFLCVEVAIRQAREFHTTWQSEIVRYIVHGLLHLCGYDDLAPTPRRRMKREENRLVRRLSMRFNFAAISRP